MLVDFSLHQAPTCSNLWLNILNALACRIFYIKVLVKRILKVFFLKDTTVAETCPKAHLTRAIYFARKGPCGTCISFEWVQVISLLIFLKHVHSVLIYSHSSRSRAEIIKFNVYWRLLFIAWPLLRLSFFWFYRIKLLFDLRVLLWLVNQRDLLLPLFRAHSLPFFDNTWASISQILSSTTFTLWIVLPHVRLVCLWVVRKNRTHAPLICFLSREYKESYRATYWLLQVLFKHVVFSLKNPISSSLCLLFLSWFKSNLLTFVAIFVLHASLVAIVGHVSKGRESTVSLNRAVWSRYRSKLFLLLSWLTFIV